MKNKTTIHTMTEKVADVLTKENSETFIQYINELFVPELIIESTERQFALEKAHTENGLFSMTIKTNGITTYTKNVVPPLYTLIRNEAYKMYEVIQSNVFKLTFVGKKDKIISDTVRYDIVNITFDTIVSGIYNAALNEIFKTQSRLTNREMNDLLAAVSSDFLNEFFEMYMQSLKGIVSIVNNSTDKNAKNATYRLINIIKREGGE